MRGDALGSARAGRAALLKGLASGFPAGFLNPKRALHRAGYAWGPRRLTGTTPLAGGAEAVAAVFSRFFNGSPRRSCQPKPRGTLGDQFADSWPGATLPLRRPLRCSAAINDGYGPRKRSPTAIARNKKHVCDDVASEMAKSGRKTAETPSKRRPYRALLRAWAFRPYLPAARTAHGSQP